MSRRNKKKCWWTIEMSGMNAKVAKKVPTVFLILEEGSFSYFLLTGFSRVVEIQWIRRRRRKNQTKWNKKNKNSPPYLAGRYSFLYLWRSHTLCLPPEVLPFAAAENYAPPVVELRCSTAHKINYSPKAECVSLQPGLARGARASFDDIIVAVTLVACGQSGITGRCTRARLLLPFYPAQKCLPSESPAAARLFAMTSF